MKNKSNIKKYYVEIVGGINVNSHLNKLENLYKSLVNEVTITLPPWFQRKLQESEWFKDDNKKSKAYFSSAIKGTLRFEPFTFVTVKLLLSKLKYQLKVIDNLEEKVEAEKVIKHIETNDFKLKNDNKVDESSKDVIIDIYSILYAKQKLKKLLSTCNNFSGYSYNRNDVFLHMSKWILERHITDTNLFELNTIKDETISDVIHYMNPNEIYDVILQVDIERQKIDAILDAYSNAELEFISMIFNVVKAYNDKDDDFVVKFKTKVTEMEQLHKL